MPTAPFQQIAAPRTVMPRIAAGARAAHSADGGRALRGRRIDAAEAEGLSDAVVSILASATFLRERNWEDYAVNALRQGEAITSWAAALDRWQPGQGTVAQ